MWVDKFRRFSNWLTAVLVPVLYSVTGWPFEKSVTDEAIVKQGLPRVLSKFVQLQDFVSIYEWNAHSGVKADFVIFHQRFLIQEYMLQHCIFQHYSFFTLFLLVTWRTYTFGYCMIVAVFRARFFHVWHFITVCILSYSYLFTCLKIEFPEASIAHHFFWHIFIISCYSLFTFSWICVLVFINFFLITNTDLF